MLSGEADFLCTCRTQQYCAIKMAASKSKGVQASVHLFTEVLKWTSAFGKFYVALRTAWKSVLMKKPTKL